MLKENCDIEDKDERLEGESVYSMEDVNEVYPNAEVRVEKAQFSTIHLKRLVEERGELIIDPNFQRNKVWTNKQAAELVESILMGIPIPTIYLFEMKNGKKQVVDGRQRITAILDFLKDELILKDLKILKQYNGNKFSELDPKMRGVFEDYQLSFYIIQPPTPERVKYDIFDRVNRGGTQLNSQEMRNALYIGTSTKLIGELVNSQEFLDATGKGISPKRMKDQYVVLRSISFYLLKKRYETVTRENGDSIEYRSDMDDFLAKMMIFLNDRASEELIFDCRNTFLTAMKNCSIIMGKDAFRFESLTENRRPINMPLFEVMMYIFANECVSRIPEYTKKKVNDFKEKFDHKQMFSGNTDSTLNLNERYKLAEELIKQIEYDTEHKN